MSGDELVILSRLQFGFTAMFHFLFVPLSMGMAWLLVIMESVYVITGKTIYQDMTRFWGKLFGINFALGITTGLTMEFQFGTNWSYYSYYVGDMFGTPLALEGLSAFFLESTFIGLFFFGWDRLSRGQHLMATVFVAIGSSFSALWILTANAWMQNPVGAEFNYQHMRMEMSSFREVFFNPVAQVKFVHTAAAGYVTGAVFVLAISSYYLLKGRDIGFALRSFAVASGFGLASVLSVIVLGDESGYTLGEVQKAKLAAIEAEWETEKPPASFTVFGFPDQDEETTHARVSVPWVLGLIATRSVDEPVTGLKDLIAANEQRIRRGMLAYAALQKLRSGSTDAESRAQLDLYKEDLGYALLLKRYTDKVVDANDAQIKQAARDSIPGVAPMFWTFRLMVGAGFLLLLLFILAVNYGVRRRVQEKRWLLRAALYSIPLPWLACELGWFVAEYGRQPWAIGGILPTRMGVSSITPGHLWFSLSGFIFFYAVLLLIELFLMFKYARLGPSSLHTGRYHYERHPDELPEEAKGVQ